MGYYKVLVCFISCYVLYFQRGRLECLEWLVRHTSCVRDRMSGGPKCRDGTTIGRERTLLHDAAKYGKVRQDMFQ